ncbi:MAG: Spy/CpxP family protein refolding chaperone, partial [Planctomycetota bacterium]
YVATVAAVGLFGAGMAMAEPGGDGGKASSAEREARSGSDGERGQRRAGAEGREGRGGEARGAGMIRAMFRDVDLSDEQKERVREILQEARSEREAWMAENGDQLRELREKMADARAVQDTDAAQAVAQELRTIMSAGPSPMGIAEDVRAELTAEQAEVFDRNFDEVQQRVRDRSRGGAEGRRGAGGESGEASEDRRGPRGERAERGERGEGRSRGEGGERQRRGASGEGGETVDRAAIEERLRKFRERREAGTEQASPAAVTDEMFTDDAAEQPAESDDASDDAGAKSDQLDL